jgi:hypothetical protein
MNHLAPVSVLAFALAASAQSPATFPSDHATIPNGSSGLNWFPYSYGVSRMMAVYESWDIQVPSGHQITRIGFRADGTIQALGKSLQLQVRMGQTDRTAATLQSTFDNNWFGTPTTVFGPALFTLPDLNNPASPNPDGPLVWLTLTTPFTYDPSRNLLIEWRILANSNGGAAFSYQLDRATFESPIVTGPLGCQHSGNQIPDLESRDTKIGTNWITDLYQAPASQPVFLLVNVGGSLVTPYPLSPVFAGMPAACQGQLLPTNLAILNGVANSSGYANWQVPIPNNLAFNDLRLSSQALCLDFFAPGGGVVSNGDQIDIGVDPAMTLLYHQGSATNHTGTLQPNYGVVTLFAYN